MRCHQPRLRLMRLGQRQRAATCSDFQSLHGARSVITPGWLCVSGTLPNEARLY
jgi:hypothetical protein